MKRKSRQRSPAAVELNLAAMLDMAFQLLTFFILTFQPAPIEGGIALRMPPAAASSKTAAHSPPSAAASSDAVARDKLLRSVDTLTIRVSANATGAIGLLSVDAQAVGNLARLDERLRRMLADPESPHEQVIIEAGGDLRYDALMQVLEICTRQQLSGGRRLGRLSLVEVPTGA